MSSHSAPGTSGPTRKQVTLPSMRQMHAKREPITMLTCYDSTFARLLDEAEVDALLIGDSLGMVLQGKPSTIPVSLDEVAYHTRCVTAATRTAWVIADLPFGSYHAGVDQGIRSAAALMQAGAHMVKLEGGGWTSELVHKLVERGIPVCAHLGLTPQSIHAIGGFRVQGRTEEAAALLIRHASELHEAGASMLVLELTPEDIAASISARLPGLITIGIGAGPQTSGQVLVLHDMLGLSPGKPPRFVKNFLAGSDGVSSAVRAYVAAVRHGDFPAPANYDY